MTRFAALPIALCLLLAWAAGAPAPAPLVLLREGDVALVAEKSTQRLHLYEWRDGHARFVETLPCTTGKVRGDKQSEGDLRTPEGAYRFLRAIPGRQLPPLYGAGALTMDYPNPFDQLDGKTGSGIWMHGVEHDDRVTVACDTRGCVALRNGDFERVRRLVRLQDTPIVVVERLATVPLESLEREAEAVQGFVESWRRDWEAGALDAYLARYDSRFLADGRGKEAWARQKREIARDEPERRIAVSTLTILREKDRWWVSFTQEYAASGHHDIGRKTLYLRGTPPSLRIVSESWRPLDLPKRLEEPGEPEPRMTPARVAARAPEAAPTATVAQAAKHEPAAPEPARPSAPEPAPAPPAPDTPEATAPSPPAATAAAAPEPPASAPAPAKARRLSARLDAPRTTRRTFSLFAPHVQRVGESLLVQVQLLNAHATSARTGVLVVTLPSAPGVPPPPPQIEPFAVKQGRLIALTLPDAGLPLRVGLLVRDEGGKVALDQDLVLDEAP